MNRFAKAGLSVGTLALALGLFQNCSGAKFSDAPKDASSTAGTSGNSGGLGTGGPTQTVTIPGGGPTDAVPAPTGGTPLAPTSPEAAGICYDVTCVSDAGRWKTAHGVTNSEGVVTVLAPSKGSEWVIAVNKAHQVYSSLNCYVDADVNDPPDFYNAQLCTANAASSVPGYPITQGKGRYLSQCSLTPCGYIATDSYTATNVYEWIVAGYSATSKTATVKVRVRYDANGANGGGPFGIDANVGLGQCVVQSVNTTTGTYAVNFCLSNGMTLQAVLPDHTFSLSLNGLNSLN